MNNFYFLISLIPSFLLVFFFFTDVNFSFSTSLKFDSILIVLGNFLIAIFIASVINKEHKNVELKIDNCFKELDSLLTLFNELRQIINENKFLEDNIIRYDGLISLQIQLIKKYNFVPLEYIEKLDKEYYQLNTFLTEEDNKIDDKYKYALLNMEYYVLNIKSCILK